MAIGTQYRNNISIIKKIIISHFNQYRGIFATNQEILTSNVYICLSILKILISNSFKL